ncbi:hypothetical protein [Burkholderia sp. SIMBA_062]|uniref:hypothetical protein n=1 Tax=Burkholderia sp. SIMBA_062 TaxID=3085803 RepID=UPI00397E866E
MRDTARLFPIDHKAAARLGNEVGRIEAGPFDVIVLNSVVQLFSSHQYLRSVLASCARLLADGGTIFIGDVMDARTKDRVRRG